MKLIMCYKYGEPPSINFIDSNDIFFGFGWYDSCCENYGFVITDQEQDDFNALLLVREPTENEFNQLYDEYVFDTEYFYVSEQEHKQYVRLKMMHGHDIKYLTVYNLHNGYYGKGFTFGKGEKTLERGII